MKTSSSLQTHNTQHPTSNFPHSQPQVSPDQTKPGQPKANRTDEKQPDTTTYPKMKPTTVITLFLTTSTTAAAAAKSPKDTTASANLDALLARAYSMLDLEGVCAKQVCTSSFIPPFL